MSTYCTSSFQLTKYFISMLGYVIILLYTQFAQGQQSILPLEVIGPEGYQESLNFSLNSPPSVGRLYLKVHRPVYRDISTKPSLGAKASVSVNGGDWIDINNNTAEPFEHEQGYGGLNGGYHTVRLYLPVSGLKYGDNEVRFRFNGTDGFTNGYRILEFNVIENGEAVLPANTFTYDDPSLWTAPLSNASDVVAGKVLWEEALLRESPIDNRILKAKCASCHAADGRDLKYFNYSNWSIQARSEFHGLSETEAKQIASYIRSLDAPAPDKARPWNPPYQPGPGLDSKPAVEWSAGAGLEAVLEKDNETVREVFNGQLDFRSLQAVADIEKTLNVRETKVAIQLPDWNAWLPEVHPIEFLGDAFYDDVIANDLTLYDSYAETMKLLRENPLNSIIDDGRLHLALSRLAKISTSRNNRTARVLRLDADQPVNSEGDRDKLEYRHVIHWGAVKTWEVMQTFELDGIAPRIFGADGEARSWISLRRNVFDLAPHQLAGDLNTLPWQDIPVAKYFSTAWYQLQLTINSGNKAAANLWPVDWNYQPAHIADLHKSARGEKQPFRYYLSHIKMMQQYNDGRTFAEETAMNLRQLHPGRYAPYGGNTHYHEIFEQLNPEVRQHMFETLLIMAMDLLEQHDVDSWLRNENTRPNHTVRPKSYVPQQLSEREFQGKLFNRHYADAWFSMIPSFRDIGVREFVLDRMIDWGALMWPLGDWEALRAETTNGRPTALANYPVDGLVGETLVFDASQSYDDDGSIVRYQWMQGDNVQEGPIANYTFDAVGSYTITLEVTDDDGAKGTKVFTVNIQKEEDSTGNEDNLTNIDNFPEGFVETIIISGMQDPASIAFSPDGRIFYGERITGKLRVAKKNPTTGNWEILPEAFYTFDVPKTRHRSSGLRGFTFDPNFEQNGYIYAFYMKDNPRHNRVVRIQTNPQDPDKALPGETLLINIPFNSSQSSGSHNGGDLTFGTDGKLYFTTGDGWNGGDNVQSLTTYVGKLFRINKDGSIPRDNPFYNQTNGNYRAIYCVGLRNPFGITTNPNSGNIYITDAVNDGKATIYQVKANGSSAGHNFGHDGYNGIGTSASQWASAAETGGKVITGGAWYPNDGYWSIEFHNNFFVALWGSNNGATSGMLARFDDEINPITSTFATNIKSKGGRPLMPEVGPDGNLYYLLSTYETTDAEIRMARYTGVPTVVAPIFTPTAGQYDNPIQVTLNSSTEGATIYYTIDGSIPTESSILYTGPFSITENISIRAKAFKTGLQPSNEQFAEYFIGAVSNIPPTANAGPDLTVEVNTIVTLNGTDSFDPDSDILTLSEEWEQVSGPPVFISDADETVANFTPTVLGEYVFRIIVTDIDGAVDTDEVIINVVDEIPDILDNLIARWSMEEGNGDKIEDTSDNSNTGTRSGTQWSESTPDNSDFAMEFDGIDDYIDVGNIDVTGQRISITFWFKADDFGVHDARFISKAAGAKEDDHYWMVSTVNSTKLRFRLKTDGNTTTLISPNVLTAGQWYHVAAVYDGTEMKIFLDGSEIASTPKVGELNSAPSVNVALGNQPIEAEPRPFDGLIDEMRIYGKALNEQEIQVIKDASPIIETKPVTPPEAPSELSAEIVNRNTISLEWMDNSIHESGFTVERKVGESDFEKVITIAAGITVVTDEDILPNTTYTYRVYASNSSGNSGYSNEVTITTPTDQPEPITPVAPSNLIGEALSSTGISLNWQDLSGNEEGFKIERKTRNGDFEVIITLGTDIITYTDESLQPNTAYTYRVFAFNTIGNSDFSNEVTIMTPEEEEPSVPPVAPSGLVADILSDTEVSLNWGDNSIDEDGFRIELKIETGEFTETGIVNKDITAFLVSELSANTTYTFRIQAFNSIGDSEYSNEVTVTTLFESTNEPNDTLGIIARWSMEEGLGAKIFDTSGNEHHGSINGNNWVTETEDNSQFSLSFDGVDDAVEVPNLDIPTDGMTITFWFKADDFGINDARFISKANGQFDNNHFWMVSTSRGQRLRFRLKTNGKTTTLISPTNMLEVGVWTHIAAVYDGAEMRLFKNGEMIVSTTKTGMIDTNPTVNVALGNQPTTASGGARPFDGLLDEVRIYGKGLSIEELNQIMNETLENNPVQAVVEKTFTVYPNPVSNGRVTVSSELISGEINVQIFDIKGILNDSVTIPINTELNVSNFTPGIYILKIRQGDIEESQTMVIDQ